jgi:hypothetical protein
MEKNLNHRVQITGTYMDASSAGSSSMRPPSPPADQPGAAAKSSLDAAVKTVMVTTAKALADRCTTN